MFLVTRPFLITSSLLYLVGVGSRLVCIGSFLVHSGALLVCIILEIIRGLDHGRVIVSLHGRCHGS